METVLIVLSIVVVILAICFVIVIFKLITPDNNNAEIAALASKLKTSGDALKDAINKNTPK